MYAIVISKEKWINLSKLLVKPLLGSLIVLRLTKMKWRKVYTPNIQLPWRWMRIYAFRFVDFIYYNNNYADTKVQKQTGHVRFITIS